MPDGTAMRAGKLTSHDPLSLDEAIARLEAGADAEGMSVDLGDGRLASADGHRGGEGLLQRLRGHKMMLALASGSADLSRFAAQAGKVSVLPQVQEILDAARQKD